jgi:hypothetical protein
MSGSTTLSGLVASVLITLGVVGCSFRRQSSNIGVQGSMYCSTGKRCKGRKVFQSDRPECT